MWVDNGEYNINVKKCFVGIFRWDYLGGVGKCFWKVFCCFGGKEFYIVKVLRKIIKI